MIDKTDWRLTRQGDYLSGKTLYHRKWKARSSKWDHEHCVFCWEKFSAIDGTLHEGYATQDGYYWICPNCFHDFKAMFGWTVIEDTE
ncbi:hypothetical protein WMO64_05590 [Pseudoflavonifractor sp. CLA-AP-H29]|uniref:Uncharacterized protein n=1 Tax=Pseudoflavonifractor intestinihominis TaxID=3133171 RepID=A0ABV1E6L2_9FIRM